MSDLETRFHEDWLGMVQPDGLVVSIPVLVDAQCMQRLEPAVQHRLLELCPRLGGAAETAPKGKRGKKTAIQDEPATAPGADGPRAIADLDALLAQLLQLTPDLFDRGAALSDDLAYYAQEGGQTIRPTLALRRQDGAPQTDESTSRADDSTPASRAGAPYVLLVWDLGPVDLDLDRPETTTGPWHYPASAKFDRLLRHVRCPIGLLTNRRAIRLVHAPHGESTGSITFKIDDMTSVGGRPILEAFVMLLSATRLFGVAPEKQLPALLRESRTRQANVTNELAAQVFDAVQVLLAGFEAAAERDGDGLLRDALTREDDHLYGGLLTVLLRLVFLLYAEDRGLLPTENSLYEEHLSVLGLFDQLQADHGLHPDTMPQRFGAWGRLLTVFRAIYLGVEQGDLRLPARRGELFDPHRYQFLEGWTEGASSPINSPEEQSAVDVPTVDDGTVHGVLERLLVFQGQRLSYRALDVEQIGSVYEALMGHHVRRVMGAAVCLRPNRVWVTAQEVLEQPKNQRAKWLQEEAGLAKGQAEKLAKAVTEAAGPKDDEAAVLEVLEGHAVKGMARVAAGRLVIQPGAERRRTSSHYTPRSLSAPIVRRTIEPLLAAMKPLPTSRAILDLKICDPAMGSGAFLVEACRFRLLSRIRGGSCGREARQACDRARFLRLCRSGSHTPFS